MADALVKYETIDEEQLKDIMAGKIPRPPKDWDETLSNKPPRHPLKGRRWADRLAGRPTLIIEVGARHRRAPTGSADAVLAARVPGMLRCGSQTIDLSRPVSWACSMSPLIHSPTVGNIGSSMPP